MNIPFKVSLVLSYLFFAVNGYSQSYVLPNETLVFSFQTRNNKKACLVMDKQHKYLVYRFGTAAKIEFQYPEPDASSWSKFTCFFYHRGGGVGNDGKDLNGVSFTNKGFEYTLYDNYHDVGDKREVGVRVKDLHTQKEVNIPGLPSSRKGNLAQFQDSHLIKIDEDRID